jgi:hypothetical protein
MKSLFLSVLLAAIAAGSAFAGSTFQSASGCTFPCNENTQSLGQFIIMVAAPFQAALNGVQGYDPTSGLFISPLLYDSNTIIGTSTAYTDGSRPASLTVGATASGPPAVTAVTETNTNAPTAVPAGYPTGQDAISTAILNTSLAANGFQVNIGASYPSGGNAAGMVDLGEVQASNCSNNVPAGCNDFPAQSFFDVFADISVPGLGDFSNPSNQPLVVSSTLPAGSSLPPKVLYVHGQSGSVSIVGDTNNPNFAGDTLGTFVLTGHGASYQNTPSDDELFGDELEADVNADSSLNTEEKSFLDAEIDSYDLPEPSTLVLLFSGAAGLLGWRRFRLSR